MRSSPLATGRSGDLTRRRLIEDAISLPRGGIPVLDLDGATIRRSYVAGQAHSVAVIAKAIEKIHAENESLVAYGPESLTLLYEHPLRSIDLPNEHVVLSAFDGSEGIQVLESSWPVVRNPDLTIKEIEPGDLDELAYPSARAALTSELRRMVAATDFRPWKGYRVALVVGPRAERDMPGLTQKLVVSGAVAGADVEIAPAGDLNDETHLRRLAKFVENNRHQMVFSISKPEESWVSRLMKSFSRRVPWVRLAFQDADVAIEQFDASIENALDTAPGYPLFVWGSDALERIEAYEGDAFQLSRLAKRSLRSNPYPNVERMLEHVEKLAMCANRWHEEGTGGERLEDWVLERFELAIALRDSKLDGSSWTVEYRNSTNPSSHQELDAQPHVKVDDHTDLRHCGRIYFGLERDARVIVVRQVGIHA